LRFKISHKNKSERNLVEKMLTQEEILELAKALRRKASASASFFRSTDVEYFLGNGKILSRKE
jgi:hypothetical protein